MTLLLAFAFGSAWADDVQYRHLLLGDGREIEAIILKTDTTGFRVQVPQGEMTVGFDFLEDMRPSTKANYDAQPYWTVLLAAPDERINGLVAAFKVVPHIRVVTLDTASSAGITPAAVTKMAACNLEIDCLAEAAKAAPWMWIVSAKQDGSNLSFRARTNKGTRFKSPIVASMIRSEAVVNAAWSALELTPSNGQKLAVVTPPPVDTKKPPTDVKKPTDGKKPADGKPAKPGSFDRDRTVAMSFAPVPGLPSLANGDATGFGLAIATVVPATVAWVGVVGKNTQSAPSFVGVSLAGFYAFTVVANQAFGLRGHDKISSTATTGERKAQWAMIVTPTEHGGGMLTVNLVE
jgi:hypothetical protein